jgi:hypothetical protein
LPEGVVYINYRYLAHGRLFSVVCAWLSEGKQPDSTGTDNRLSRLCAFQAEVNEFAGMVAALTCIWSLSALTLA